MKKSAISDFGIRGYSPVKLTSQPFGVPSLKTKTYIREYGLFRARLKEARESAGLTQAEVARLMSQPQSFISKAESGERRVDFIELRHLAKIYKKPLSFFEP